MVRIFLAHASEDKDAVIDLYNRLKAKGFKPWLDKVDLLPGQSWRAEIPKAIRESDVFIACLSKASVAKQGYIQREFRMALQKMGDMPPGKIYLIPVRLDDCQVPALRQEEYGINLADYQWVDLFRGGEFERLVKSIELHFPDVLGKSRSTSTSDAPANSKMSENPSYEEVLARLKQLEDNAKTQSSPKYDLRGAQFAGGFAETVLGNQGGGIIRNGPSEPLTPDSSRPTIETKAIDLGNGVTLELVRIPGGTFLMGSPKSEKDSQDSERPQHMVAVPEFWMGKYLVTQVQYQTVGDENLSGFQGESLPVERVSWRNAIAFCDKVSQKTGETIRLPSEAQWEYACRAGTTTPFYFGETISTDQADYKGTATYGRGKQGINREATTEVGTFPPNEFGIYDMHGNVWEWCLDHWHDNYHGAPSDGSAWIRDGAPNYRVIRGGSWVLNPEHCRSARRNNAQPRFRDFNIGFRVVCLPQDS